MASALPDPAPGRVSSQWNGSYLWPDSGEKMMRSSSLPIWRQIFLHQSISSAFVESTRPPQWSRRAITIWSRIFADLPATMVFVFFCFLYTFVVVFVLL